jgi:Fe-S-cluster containining protein
MSFNLLSTERRAPLLGIMSDLMGRSINCFSCSGVCCTFEANSMLVTPLEAAELYQYLESEKRVGAELLSHLESTIKRYRLDVELQTHRNQFMRKTYTCPFYEEGPRGCAVSRTVKPYGCLGFNPTKEGCSGNGGCESYTDRLLERDEKWEIIEQEANLFIAESLSLSWKKIDICRALLNLHEKRDLLDNIFFEGVARQLEQ